MARRPDREVTEVLSTPDAASSLTMLETVAGESPVEPASSTWVRCPWCFSDSTMRTRLASRSEVCEPGVGLRLGTLQRYTRSSKTAGISGDFERPESLLSSSNVFATDVAGLWGRKTNPGETIALAEYSPELPFCYL